MHHGSCLCNQIKFEIAGEFKGFFFCHCSRCRKQTGSAHASNLFSVDAKLSWIAGHELVRTYHHPETRFEKSFCTHCGSALPTQQKGRLLVPAGCLDSEVSVKPNAHIFVGSRANWDNELEQVPKFDLRPS